MVTRGHQKEDNVIVRCVVFPSHCFLHKQGIDSVRWICVGLVTSSEVTWSMFSGSAAEELLHLQLQKACPYPVSLRFQVQSRSTNMSGLGDSSTDPANPDSRKRKGSPCDTAQRYVHCSQSVPCRGYFVIPAASLRPVCSSRWSQVSATRKHSHFPPELRFAFSGGCGGRWSMMEMQLPICSACC